MQYKQYLQHWKVLDGVIAKKIVIMSGTMRKADTMWFIVNQQMRTGL